jgi:transposase
VTRQLMAGQLAERSNEVTDSGSQSCPDCGQSSSRADTERRKLDSLRGLIEYDEPAYHCPSCRRAFFPGSRLDGPLRASHVDSQVD